MNAPPSRKTPAQGHVAVPAAAIGSLALILAAGLESLGILAALNGVLGSIAAGADRELPAVVIWTGAAVFSYGLAFAMLGTPATWRRTILWLTTVVLALAWAPVLVLAAFRPLVGAWIIAAVWSGVCALVYAWNHLMPADEPGRSGAPAGSVS